MWMIQHEKRRHLKLKSSTTKMMKTTTLTFLMVGQVTSERFLNHSAQEGRRLLAKGACINGFDCSAQQMIVHSRYLKIPPYIIGPVGKFCTVVGRMDWEGQGR